jgi:hypothetical protein
MLLITQRVFERENAAPRMTEQKEIVGVETECATYLLNLFDKAWHLP